MVKKRGVRSRSGRFVIGFLKGEQKRLGVVVTSYVGNSVQRNRIKRIIREFFRLNINDFPAGDCVFIPMKGSASLDNDCIRAELKNALAVLKGKLR